MRSVHLRPEDVLQVLERLAAPPRYLLAYSTGPDSTALLDSLVRVRERLPAPLAAVHVHHGLDSRADDWAELAERQCARHGIPLSVHRVSVLDTGEGLEAAARRARYAALETHMGHGDALITGQHADDQAETVLLQLLRASGPRGLAGMPEERRLGRGRLVRPLLAWRKSALLEYCRRRGLEYTLDPHNRAPERDRNWLRHEILPQLQARWPRAVENLGVSAELLGESEALLAAATTRWLETVAPNTDGMLELAPLHELEPPARRRVVRLAIERLGLKQPPRRQLEELLRQAESAAADRCPAVEWDGGTGRVHGGRLHLDARRAAPAIQAGEWRPPQDWQQSGVGRLRLEPVDGTPSDAPAAWPVLTVQGRSGGERIDLGEGRRAVKALLREAGLPPWERNALPFIYAEQRLVAVADLWLDRAFREWLQRCGLRLRWIPEAAEEPPPP